MQSFLKKKKIFDEMLALCYHKTIEKNHRAFGNLPPLPYLWSLGIYISCTFLLKKKSVCTAEHNRHKTQVRAHPEM